jgi:hypothetical protein
MRQDTFGTALRSLVAVGTLISAVALGACGKGGSTTTVAATVGVTTATVVAVQTAALTFPHGRMFDPSLTDAVTLTFNTTPPNTFALVGTGGATATGVVSYGSTSGASLGPCTFTFVTTGGLLSEVGSVTIPTCRFLVSALNVEPGGSQENGAVVLSFSDPAGTATSNTAGTVNSNAVGLPVLLNDNSELFVVNPAGQQVDMGVVA